MAEKYATVVPDKRAIASAIQDPDRVIYQPFFAKRGPLLTAAGFRQDDGGSPAPKHRKPRDEHVDAELVADIVLERIEE